MHFPVAFNPSISGKVFHSEVIRCMQHKKNSGKVKIKELDTGMHSGACQTVNACLDM